MSFYYSSDNLNDIHKTLMMTLHDDYDCQSSPRGKPIKELIAASFTLTDPRNRIIVSPARNVNYGFAVGELCWYVRGDRDLDTMLYYNKRMSQFSDDGKTINSAYGHRMFDDVFFDLGGARSSQFDHVVRELKNDPHSRRAVMHINQPADLRRATSSGSKDVPCTMSIQLLIRNRMLHMHVLMRSNDVVWGLPYDVFSFTCLQEAFLYQLQEAGVQVDDLGGYHHTAGSLHVYDTHFGMAEEVSKEPDDVIAPMKPFTLAELGQLAELNEVGIRTSNEALDADHGFGETVSWMRMRLLEHRQKRDAEAEQKKAEQRKALDELIDMTDRMGLYEKELKSE